MADAEGTTQDALARIADYEQGLRPRSLMGRLLRAIGGTRPFIAVYRRLGPLVDPWLMRRTGGLLHTHVYGIPLLLLTATGAKSGKPRLSPLLYVRDGDDFVVVGTNWGTTHHPAWTANLRAHPDASIEVSSERLAVHASEVEGDAYETIWQRFVDIYPGYAAYRARLTHRRARMFRLRPDADASR